MKKKAVSKSIGKKDQYTIVLEDIRDQFSAFGEVLSMVQDDVKVLKVGQKRLETRFDNLETRFDNHETRFDNLATRFDVLESKVDATFEEVGRLREDVNGSSVKKAEKSDVKALDIRVRVLEHARR